MKIAADCSTARRAFAGLAQGVCVHGFSDGSWSLIDGIRELLRIAGPSKITLSTWTAAAADLREAERLLRASAISDFRLLIDASFASRQPAYCAAARTLFGDDAIRVWKAHSKFCVVEGRALRALYLTSANLNRNKRLESWSVIASSELVADYLALVDRLWALQPPGAGFRRAAVGAAHSRQLMSER